ncbi:hypothetical protein [Galbitalea soli]|uniref:Uncharacterized protein n=1 Tax=Galbitalea soli TaxID=1268042 RepID=A0A7C9PNL3_9MICO|nr:hypothetical protein [Galbitalea soli]NEM91710.1 hypothetical protein [Galbitalea soli]NYJ30406.1 hypothetical protein [Galbitalea soli]
MKLTPPQIAGVVGASVLGLGLTFGAAYSASATGAAFFGHSSAASDVQPLVVTPTSTPTNGDDDGTETPEPTPTGVPTGIPTWLHTPASGEDEQTETDHSGAEEKAEHARDHSIDPAAPHRNNIAHHHNGDGYWKHGGGSTPTPAPTTVPTGTPTPAQ